MAESIIKTKSFELAKRIVLMYKYLSEKKNEFVLSKQLLRSGTAIGANVREAKNGESTKDFIHKLAVAQKECDETLYWLELLLATSYITDKEYESIYPQTIEVMKMISSALLTSKRKLLQKKS